MERAITARKLRPALMALALLCFVFPARLWAAPVNSLPPGGETGRQYCLWLYWSPEKADVTGLEAKVRGGAVFTETAQAAARAGGKQVRFSLDCLKAGELDPVVFEVARRLKVGQTSTPFALAKGWAMIMRTTMAYRQRGKALFDQGRHAQAERAFLNDLKLQPRDAAVWHLLALSRAAQRNLTGGLKAIDRALALAPANPDLMQDKATMLAYAGKLSEALELYRRADRLDPDNPTVQSNMAWVMSLKKQDLAKAQKLAAKAVSARPENGRFWYTLGLVYQARGNLKDAVKALEQAASLGGAPPEVLKKLALAKREMAAKGIGKAGPPAERPRPEEDRAAAPPEKSVPPEKPTEKPAVAANKKEASQEKVSEPKPKATPQKQAGEVYLQVATILDRKMALEELKPMVESGFKPFVRDWKGPKGRNWMAFYLGPLRDTNAAEALGSELREKGLLDSCLVRVMRPGFRKRLGRDFDFSEKAGLKPAQMAQNENPATAAPKVADKPVQADKNAALKSEPEKAPEPKAAAQKDEAPAPAGELKPGAAAKAPPKDEPTPEPEPVKQPEAKSPAQEPAAKEPKPLLAKSVPENPQADKPKESGAGPGQNEVYIQIATLPSEEMAKIEARGLINAGYDPFVRTWQDRRGRTWEVLYLGPLDSDTRAAALAEKLKAKHLIHSFEVRYLENDFRHLRGRPLASAGKREKAVSPESEPEPKPAPELKQAVKPQPEAKPEEHARNLKPVQASTGAEPALKHDAPAAKRQKPAPEANPDPVTPADPPDITKPVVVPLRPAGPSRAYLVVSAQPDRASAYTEASRFRKAGYKTRLSAWPRQDGKVWQRVLLGPFPDKEQALEAADELKKKGMITKYELLVRD